MNNEFILTTSPDRQLFQEIGDYLEKELRLQLITKLSGTDQSYWDFKLKEHQVTLHLEHYSGISLYPSKSEKPSEEALKMIHFVSDLIKNKFRL